MTSALRMSRSMPLEGGMRLSREEFHALYLLHPEIKLAELIDGVVYVPSPVSRFHGPQQSAIVGWAFAYSTVVPGVLTGDNMTCFLGGSEVQPDCMLWREGGQARFTDDGYLEGAPEFVAEITASSRQCDLGVKKELYRRSGVQEYLVWRTLDGVIDWWRLDHGEYVPLTPGSDGITASLVFPGLRLNLERLLNGDQTGILSDLR